MTPYIQVTTSAGSEEEADAIARRAIERRLAACAQVVGPVSATYWWRDAIETASEWLCVMKTERALYDDLEAAIRAAHSYETPEIIAMPVEAGSAEYLAWLSGELRPAETGS